MRHYSPYGQEKGGKTFFAILIGIIIGIGAGYFGNIYLTEATNFFAFKSLIIGAVAGALTAFIVHAISGSKHKEYY